MHREHTIHPLFCVLLPQSSCHSIKAEERHFPRPSPVIPGNVVWPRKHMSQLKEVLSSVYSCGNLGLIGGQFCAESWACSDRVTLHKRNDVCWILHGTVLRLKQMLVTVAAETILFAAEIILLLSVALNCSSYIYGWLRTYTSKHSRM